MSLFCTDSDLLLWEPNLLAEAAFASQTLISGTANLSGTTLTIAAGSLADAHVEPEQVVVLGGAVGGVYPIVSIDSATTMTVSILYEGMWRDAAGPTPVAVGTATGLTFAVRTFWAQRRIVSDLLTQAVGLVPGVTATPPTTIENAEALRRPCTLGTLHLVYSILAAAADAPEIYRIRQDLYERLYRREMRGVVVHLDTDADGRVDTIRKLNTVTLQRT